VRHLIALLIAWPLWAGLAGPAGAQAVTGEVSVAVENGYARMIFKFDEEIEAKVRLANNILTINFPKPVNVSINPITSHANEYVSAARRDPDGKGIRMALSRKVTMNSMTAGERLFVDLLPDTWTGLAPGLPRDVIEELARRAREAERRVRQQRALAQQQKAAPIRVKAITQPTFTRYIFDLPELIGVSADNSREQLTLSFDALLRFDLADVQATLPPAIESIESHPDHETVVVRFNFAARVDVRTFREDSSFVVDVEAAERRPGSVRSDNLASMAAELADRMNGQPAATPPKSVPPQAAAPAAPAQQAASPPAQQSPAQQPQRPARLPSVQQPPVQQSAGQPPVQQAPAQQPPVQQPPAEQAAPPVPLPAAEQPTPAAQDAPAPTVARPQSPPQQSSPPQTRPPQTPPPAVASQETAQPAQNGAVRAVVKRNGENVVVEFPFAAPTPAAIFRRADTVWMVFDTDATIGITALNSEPKTIRSASVVGARGVALVRVKLERPQLISVAAEGNGWEITFGSEIVEPTRPLAISRHIIPPARSSISIAIDDARSLHRIEDPDVGDLLYVITAAAPARGFLKSQDFVEFRALASAHGIALQPLADDVNAELSADKVVVSRPTGLSLSAAARSSTRALYQRQVLDVQSWGFDRQANFMERKTQLVLAAADAPEAKRLPARCDLARFYLARDMFAEAKAVLDVALADHPPSSDDSTTIVLRAIANIMIGRPDAAMRDLGNPFVGNQHDAPLWRAMANARLGRWAEARDGFRAAEAAMTTLPLEFQRTILKDMVLASLEVGDVTGAVSRLNEFETVGIPREFEPTIAVLSGRLAEALGKIEDALRAYRAAHDSWDRPAAAEGRLREIQLQYRRGNYDRPGALADLETLTTIWRGDRTEIEAQQLLARLYTEEGRYRQAFSVMRSALRTHPNSDMTRRIQEEAVSTFDGLFLAGKGDVLPAIDALALFYDFRDLTPVGRRGDEMIRRLADRLVSVDLLYQAGELLQHQVDHRLQGAARAQVASRLAVIYLLDRKPGNALAALRTTRIAELNNNLRNQRLLLEARALSELGRHDVAYEVVANIKGREAIRLRSDILWAAKKWASAAEQLERLYGDRWKEFAPLTDAERADIMRAAVGYAMGEDAMGLARFRERYLRKMGEGPDGRAFEVVTAPIEAQGTEFTTIARSIAAIDTLEAFLRDLRTRYPETGAGPSAQRRPQPQASPAASSTAG
jgi:tetratricopeptide (TPR) repeat protein